MRGVEGSESESRSFRKRWPQARNPVTVADTYQPHSTWRISDSIPSKSIITMTDHVSADVRRQIMASVKTKNTATELLVQKMLHRIGYIFRLHRKDLLGKFDLFPGRRKIVFVHGCFLHGHNCRWGHLPQSRLDYWELKIEENRVHDAKNQPDLKKLGWGILILWQCELKNKATALERLCNFLDTPQT